MSLSKKLPVKNAVQVGMRNELHVIDTSDPNTEFEMYGTKILPPNRTQHAASPTKPPPNEAFIVVTVALAEQILCESCEKTMYDQLILFVVTHFT